MTSRSGGPLLEKIVASGLQLPLGLVQHVGSPTNILLQFSEKPKAAAKRKGGTVQFGKNATQGDASPAGSDASPRNGEASPREDSPREGEKEGDEFNEPKWFFYLNNTSALRKLEDEVNVSAHTYPTNSRHAGSPVAFSTKIETCKPSNGLEG